MKKKGRINSVKVEYDGHIFDSSTEYEFYVYMKYLRKEFGIKEIIIQPHYTLIESYEVKCWKCYGTGKVYNDKSKRENKCRRCDDGIVTKPSITFTPDFKIIYEDGREIIVDVKGFKGQDKGFNLRKRIFESIHGREINIVRFVPSKGWVWET